MEESTLEGDWLTKLDPRTNPLLSYDPVLPNGDFPDYAFSNTKEKNEIIEAIQNKDDAKIKQIAIGRILEHRTREFIAWVKRSPYMWFRSRIQRHMLYFRDSQTLWTAFAAVMFMLNIFVVVFGATGLLISVISKDASRIFVVPILYIWAIYFPLYNTEPRYTSGVLCFMYLFDVVALFYILRLRRCGGRLLNWGGCLS